jgi:phosphate transport system substrate-binding protein
MRAVPQKISEEKGIMNKKWLIVVVTVLLAAWTAPAWTAEIKLCGAASMIDGLINPKKSAVEKITGDRLVINPSNAGKGIIDLVDGKCDAALVSASIETVAQGAKALGRDIDASKLRMTVVASDEIVFIVHPSNPVKSLGWEQLRDIHTGKITNWKEVGGKDTAIVVYTDAAASATRGMIKQVIMGGKDYTSAAITLDHVSKVNDMVAANPAGIGGLGKGFVRAGQVNIVTSKKLERPFAFITIGEPAGPVKKVIEAYREAAGNK